MSLGKVENGKHQYSEPWDDSDVTLIVEEEKFHVHSMILGFASPVFKAMLSSNFKEGKEKVINLPGKSKTTVLAMLNLIYPIEYRITNYSCCQALLEFSREYSMKKVAQNVDDFLNEKVRCSLDVLKLAEKYDLEKTTKKAISHFITVERAFAGTDVFKRNWNDVSENTKLEIVCGMIKNLHGDKVCCACGSNINSISTKFKNLTTATHAFK